MTNMTENMFELQIEADFEAMDQYLQKCRTLLDNKVKRKEFPSKQETESIFTTIDSLISKNEELSDDIKLFRQLLSFAYNRKWREVKGMVFSVCMELDAAECKYLKKDAVTSVLNKPDSIDLANFDVWKNCSLANDIYSNDENEELEEYEEEFIEYFADPLPSKIAKSLINIYDNEWSDAFNQMKKYYDKEKDEDDIIKDISAVTQQIFQFIKEKANKQIENLTVAISKVIAEPVKPARPKSLKVVIPKEIELNAVLPYARLTANKTAILSLPRICKDFSTNHLSKSLKPLAALDKVSIFIDKCANIAWRAHTMERPMVLIWPSETRKEDLFQYFRYFTKFGATLDYGVWPALLLYDKGPVLVKGCAQLK